MLLLINLAIDVPADLSPEEIDDLAEEISMTACAGDNYMAGGDMVHECQYHVAMSYSIDL